MERPAWAPHGIDLSVPSVSRMYDYYLGGSHNFEVDREAARRALDAVPGLPKLAQANRAFMRRAVRHAVSRGVTQFLDVGSGIPTFGNVHEVAREASGEARVVYVDNDPVAVAHSRAVLGGDPHTDVVAADFRDPQAILAAEPVRRLLDLRRPVALMLVALLPFFSDEEKPGEQVAELRDALAPGSLLMITHIAAGEGSAPPEQVARIVDVYRSGGSTLAIRTREEIAGFFAGFDLEDPGVVPIPDWRPDGREDEDDPVVYAGFAGVGRKA